MTSRIELIRKMNRVEIVDDEREIGNGIIVTLRQGYSFDPMTDNRVRGADTISEALSMVEYASYNYSGPYDE